MQANPGDQRARWVTFRKAGHTCRPCHRHKDQSRPVRSWSSSVGSRGCCSKGGCNRDTAERVIEAGLLAHQLPAAAAAELGS